MHGVTHFTQPQLWVFLGSALTTGVLCAARDMRYPGELPSLVIGVPTHAALNIAYALLGTEAPAGVPYATLLRSAWLLLSSLFAVGGVSVAVMLAWSLLREPR
jgi:hypothetical protein